MGNEKSGNKKNRVMFFYENDTELFKEAWARFTGRSSDFDKWKEATKTSFEEIDAEADQIRIARAKAENAKGLDFPPEEKAEEKPETEKPVRFAEVCKEMGTTAEWARKQGGKRNEQEIGRCF